MNELIKYFESLEERIATLEAELASLEAEVDDLKSRPAPEPQVVEKEVIKEVPVEVIKEVIVEKPVEVAAPVAEPEPEVSPDETGETPDGKGQIEEVASPKAAMYGKAVDDIRLAISLGDRFLYQRELFGQNAELMQKTLTELNALNSFDEAMNYISRFGWDTESNSYQQFIVTLHRRFG
jgi:hypothetical protein